MLFGVLLENDPFHAQLQINEAKLVQGAGIIRCDLLADQACLMGMATAFGLRILLG